MSDFRAHVQAAIAQHRLFRRGERILVAVSGGLDSMVLLELLGSLAREHRWELTVAHFNHKLRGRSSDADERLVAQEAKARRLSFVSDRADVARMAREKGESIEMAAREARHEFFARAARKVRSRKIALAHHADDQVELFFVRLLRGSGMEGLAGMKWNNPSPAARTITLVRPLLSSTRQEIEAFARGEGIRFRHDATNDSVDIGRNRIRHELLPLIEQQYQPAMRKVILRLMDLLSAESDLTRTLVEDLLATGSEDFDKLPIAAQRRLLQLQLVRLGLRYDYRTVERLREESGRPIAFGPDLSVYRDASGGVHRRPPAIKEFNTGRQTVDLEESGHLRFNGVALEWKIGTLRQARVSKMRGREVFDADRVGRRVILRHWQAGDRFQPIGMPGAVKVQDLFVNARIPRARRHELVLATTEQGEIFWIEDMRISDRFKLDAGTRRRLEWAWRRPA